MSEAKVTPAMVEAASASWRDQYLHYETGINLAEPEMRAILQSAFGAHTIELAGFEFRAPYGKYDEPHVAMHRADGPLSGEGMDIPVAMLREALEAFYEAHF